MHIRLTSWNAPAHLYPILIPTGRALILGGIGLCGDMAYAKTLAEYAKRALPEMVWEGNAAVHQKSAACFQTLILCWFAICTSTCALKEFVLKGGFLAFMGGEPLAKERVFKSKWEKVL